MNVTDYSSSDVVGAVSSLPKLLWNLYLDHLVFYSADSWVATVAYSFRILAAIVFFPVLAVVLLVRAYFIPTSCPAHKYLPSRTSYHTLSPAFWASSTRTSHLTAESRERTKTCRCSPSTRLTRIRSSRRARKATSSPEETTCRLWCRARRRQLYRGYHFPQRSWMAWSWKRNWASPKRD